ncbi:MAG: T9SS type A sorting domain-containing protein [Candidatus Stygibacter australis]|nr:T9SS type A sorting domain-containing protein [Candidatus Stygibacter australis]
MNKKYFIFLVIALLPVMIFCNTWYVDCTVAQSGNGTSPAEAFQTIQEAIDCISVAEYDTILVYSGTYNEEVVIGTGFPNNITICSNYLITGDESYIETTIIDGNGADSGIVLLGPDGCIICGFTITDCYNNSENFAAGITIGYESYYINNTIIRNCIIENCINYGTGGGAIGINKGYNCKIESCIIENNINDYDNIDGSNYAGGIIANCSYYDFILDIKNCLINNNEGGGVQIQNANNFDFVLVIDNTLISNNTTYDDGAGINLDLSSLKMNLCTIIGNNTSHDNDNCGVSQCESAMNSKKINNSIILNTTEFLEYDIIRFCGHLQDDDMVPNSSNGSEGNFETTAAECFVSGDDLYHLCWDSPCIDAGEFSGTGPESGMDIGYVPCPHSTWTFTQNGGILPVVYDWRSFPRLEVSDGENNGEFIEACAMLDKFEYPGTPTDVDIWYESDGNPDFYGDWDDTNDEYNWSLNPNNNFMCSTRGYKFMVTDPDDNDSLRVFGEICEPDTDVPVVAGGTDDWVGYFLEDTQYASTAFNYYTFLKLDKIMTKNWTAVKFKNTWLMPAKATLSYGDLVILSDNNQSTNFTFQWQQPGREEIEPYVRPVPTYFSYNEDIDYMPIYVEFGEEIPFEIGVYVNGECRGAEVVDSDSLFHIRAYIYDEEPGYEVQFVQYFGRNESRIVDYQVIRDPLRTGNEKLITGNLGEWSFISFTNPLGEEVPSIAKSLSAYPNPFNPTVQVCFALAEDGVANLNVFNVKGQKVITLLKSKMCTAGEDINQVWDGRNELGKEVSGGIYLISLKANGKAQTQKVVLLK